MINRFNFVNNTLFYFIISNIIVLWLVGLACWIVSYINIMDGLYNFLQLTRCRILSHKSYKSNVYERVLFQSGQVSLLLIHKFHNIFTLLYLWNEFISHTGSLNLNPLAGKIMFRDVVFICFDYSIRVQDGYLIFRWWRSYVPKDVSEDLSHSDTRLSVMLNGFELHVFNRSELYAKLEKTFGLKPSILIPVKNI